MHDMKNKALLEDIKITENRNEKKNINLRRVALLLFHHGKSASAGSRENLFSLSLSPSLSPSWWKQRVWGSFINKTEGVRKKQGKTDRVI